MEVTIRWVMHHAKIMISDALSRESPGIFPPRRASPLGPAASRSCACLSVRFARLFRDIRGFVRARRRRDDDDDVRRVA